MSQGLPWPCIGPEGALKGLLLFRNFSFYSPIWPNRRVLIIIFSSERVLGLAEFGELLDGGGHEEGVRVELQLHRGGDGGDVAIAEPGDLLGAGKQRGGRIWARQAEPRIRLRVFMRAVHFGVSR